MRVNVSNCSHPGLYSRFTVGGESSLPCATLLSVAGFLAFLRLFPFHCWARKPPLPRFTVGQELRTMGVVDVPPAHIQGLASQRGTFWFPGTYGSVTVVNSRKCRTLRSGRLRNTSEINLPQYGNRPGMTNNSDTESSVAQGTPECEEVYSSC